MDYFSNVIEMNWKLVTMSEGQISPDGNWIWNGTEWIPRNDEGPTISPTEIESSPDYYGKIRLGLLTISLILGFIAVTGNSWMTSEVEGGINFGLNEVSVTGYGLFDYDEFCDSSPDDDDMELCNLGPVGSFTTITLWLAIISGALMIITHLFGFMDKIPAKTKFVFSWSTGALILIGTLGWVLTKPSVESWNASVGLSFWLSLIAGLLALSSEILNTFFTKQSE